MNSTITIVGLGYGDENSLSIGTWKMLQQGDSLFLRTADHPIAPWLTTKGLTFNTFDQIYEKYDTFAPVYEEIKEQLIGLALVQGDIIYAVPGHPMVAERTVQLLLQEGPSRGVEVNVVGGGSFLDIAFARLAIDPVEGFQLLDGSGLLSGRDIVPSHHLLIGQVYSKLVASEVKLSLMQLYPDDYEVTVANALGIIGQEKIQKVPLYELDRLDDYTNLTSIYVPPTTKLERKRFTHLMQLMAYLRSPDGCPWDREQTHESLRPYLIEEAYEFIDAIEQQDDEAILEELGDVLLQVIFHAQVAEDRYAFTIEDVVETLASKLIRRHPHVFNDKANNVSNSAEVVQTWEMIKQQEGKEAADSVLDNIPKAFPSILTALEQQKEAAKVGFDWDDVDGVLAKLTEELTEFAEATEVEDREAELGDLFYTLINISRFYHLNPDLALQKTIRKFDRRFRYVEKLAKQHGQPMKAYSIEQLESWWQDAKQLEKGANHEVR